MHSLGIRRIPHGENVVRIGAARRLPSETRASLVALRCPDCHHDTVVDLPNNAVWDLDLTDYYDHGSTAP